MEKIVIALIVGSAVLYVLRKALASAKGTSGCSCGEGGACCNKASGCHCSGKSE